MVRSATARLITVTLAATLALASLVGCAAQDTQAADAQAANRQYMTSVNQHMEELASDLQNFADAVSRSDVVSMRTQADRAFKVLDELTTLDAPEQLEDIQTQYIEGCTKLEQALDDYVTLFVEIASATEAQPFDYSTYDARLANIQKLYDEGIAQLESGDTLAAGKE